MAIFHIRRIRIIENFFDLEEKELELMRFFWSLDKSVTLQEFILKYGSAISDENIHLNLKGLIKKGLIKATKKSIAENPTIFYSKKMTLESYIVKQILTAYKINNNFDIRNMITALCENKDLNLSLDDVENFLNEK